MELVIAVLLGLILVAMVSSNAAAARGVFKVLRYALFGVLLLVCWLIIIGQTAWSVTTYYPESKWSNIATIACAVIVPPFLLWVNRNGIVKAYNTDKWALIRNGIFLAIGFEAVFVFGVAYNELKTVYEHIGWAFILIPLAFFSAILMYRSSKHKVPFLDFVVPAEPPDPWERINQEWRSANDALEAEWEHLEAMREQLPFEEYEAKERAHFQKVGENSAKQKALEESILLEWRARLETQESRLNSVASFGFLWFFIFAFVGSVLAVWEVAFAYSTELAGSKQLKIWLYASLMTFAYAGSITAILSALLKRK